MGMVATTLGDIDESMLDVSIKDGGATDETWTVVREGVYKGTMYPDAVGTVVRRDVWVTFKTGQSAAAEQG